ncbi:pseudouridine synthase family protein [Sporobolomyces salmoneus]|uniref:pseudouridine synthase family protein n=1 Tax=Sporobolomyces salmoneus TaxID=183962 RepID=UPI0031825080
MTAPPKGSDPNNISQKKVKQHPQPKRGTSRNSIPAPTGDFALPPPTPEYYEQDGLRKVKPYMFTYHSWAKERWQGRTLIDIYSEFRDRTQEYYEWAIESGIIVVNNRKATPNQIIQNGDLISNVAHRHEPPVVAGPVKIIYDGRLPGNDGKTLVVEKPGSMPIHSTGRYNFNTLLEILKYDYDLPMVHTSNRLDRLTSGVMICSLTVAASKELGAWFGGQRETGVKKEYVARCVGEFPKATVVCEEPLLTLDRQVGINVVHPDGRESKTIFERMSYDEKSYTSVVLCRPITGRTHQIRVHLQYLGHPIANDPIYQNSSAWGESRGKGGVYAAESRRLRGELFMSSEQEKQRTSRDGYTNVKEGEEGIDRKQHDLELTEGAERAIRALRGVRDEADGWARDRDQEGLEMARKYQEQVGEAVELSKTTEEGDEESEEGGFCRKCFTPLIPDPKPEQLFIWLHAMRYTTTEWDWKSDLPYWAEPTYEVPLSSILS